MEKIKFSIITPTYNRATSGLLESCIRSVHHQANTGFGYEHIIVNDGSTDNTSELINKISKKDKNIIYVEQKNTGTPGAIQAGIKKSKGEYVVILGDDDILPTDSLKKRKAFADKNPDLDWFYGKTQRVDDQGSEMATWSQSKDFKDFHYARMFIENYIQGGTVTAKRYVYEKITWPSWLTTRDDDFVALELVRPGKYKFGFHDDVVYCYRAHGKDLRQSELNLKNETRLREIDQKIKYELHDPNLAFLGERAREASFLAEELKNREERLERIYNSFFWKIGKPVKILINLLKKGNK